MKRTYEEQVAEYNRIKAERGYVPYHLHRAIFADTSWKIWWLFHGPMIAIPILMFLYSWIVG